MSDNNPSATQCGLDYPFTDAPFTGTSRFSTTKRSVLATYYEFLVAVGRGPGAPADTDTLALVAAQLTNAAWCATD